MDIFSLLKMVGGLALFLYGMKNMGDNLVQLSGGKLEKTLEKLMNSRWRALLLGAAVTAVIQSSSATTVMVVGFVNSGLMKLSQAVGVIMGANIGTTITSWLLSLAGISSHAFILQLLKPSSFTPVLAIVGIVFLLTSSEGTKRKILGEIFLGFAVLMFGMETMSNTMAPLKDNPSFTNLLLVFSNPFLGILIGALLTAIIQSSSASVGILQALCLSGAVTYGTAIPIILGQNIGTCITAVLSSIGTSKNAKRAALVHLFFNLVGSLVFLFFFYLLIYQMELPFLFAPASATAIAFIHTLFNVGCAIALFPFADLLVKLTTLVIKDEEEEEPMDSIATLTALDERFLEKPSFAIQLCWKAFEEMSEYARKAIRLSMETLDEFDAEKIQSVVHLEQVVDTFEDAIGSYLVKLAGVDLSREDSHLLSILLHGINDVERMSDHAVNLTEAALTLHQNGLALSSESVQELDVLHIAVLDILNQAIGALFTNNLLVANSVEPMEEVIDDLVQELKQRHIERLKRGICSLETGILLEDILINCERISDHCSNLAVTQIEVQEDLWDTHKYLEGKTRGSDDQFLKEYQRLKKIYILPVR